MTAQAAEKKTVKSKKEKALVIVESPAKSKTIKKILGDGYQIEASFGHVRNLPDNVLGFDVNNDFKPTYVVIPEKKKVVTKLNDLAKRSDKIYLASDPDREGEAIAWHVRELLQVPDDKVFRIEFNEITPKAVKYAVEHSRQIDMDRVKAQQTRQILDKLVGYKLSPVLWKQLGNYRLSAGRVQSVALRMICEREEEIEAFIPQEYWSIHTIMDKDGKLFEAEVNKHKNKKIEIKNEEEANKIKEFLLNPETEFIVDKVTKKETKRKPTAPFITSTLQRAASSKLGFGVSKTMQVAQKLYEGIEIEGTPVGLITYMRTDSVRISDDAHEMAKSFILQNYGEKYYPATTNVYVKGKQNVQDAHEAIRPSYPERTPESIKQYLQPDQYKLYKLIWDKFMSSQMAPAEIANKTIDIKAGDYNLKAGTSKILFDGFLKLYNDAEEDEKDADAKIPDLEQGDKVKCKEITPKQHFTQPPAHYTEASLVKTLEELGIGRPSTYSPTISTILARRYITKESKNLYVTEIGEVVNSIMKESFPTIVDEHFTANMESLLDAVAEGKVNWKTVVENFYPDLKDAIDKAENELEKVTIHDEVTDEICPDCGRNLVIKYGPHGKFLACPGFPDCRFTMPYLEKIGVNCPKCGKDVVLKKTRKGRKYYGCIDNPECDFMSWGRPVAEKCPRCGGYMIVKGNKIACADEQCGYVTDKKPEREE